MRRPAPFLVAHRAGNDIARLRRAEALGAGLIEADVHLFAGRLEVRHLKTLGPVPILWDRWTPALPSTRRLRLDELLRAAADGTELMLDLKGRDGRLPQLVARSVAEHRARRPLTVCARRWELLAPLRGLPGVRLVHSVGSARQLAELRRRVGRRPLAGISIKRQLLDAAAVRDLRGRAELLMSWPVETPAEALTLVGWGVHGLISSRFEELSDIVPAAEARAAA